MFLNNINSKHKLKFNLKKKYAKKKGKILVRHKQRGHKSLYRNINFQHNIRSKNLIIGIEYDPYRSNFITKLLTKNKNRYNYNYIPSTNKLDILQNVNNSSNENYKKNNSISLKNISIGDFICNVQKYPTKPSVFARSAGTFAQVLDVSKVRNDLIKIQLPSKEQYLVSKNCKANLGKNSNSFNKYLKKWKAGKSRHIGRRPKVRGVAKNPVDHPHGGGEGKTSPGKPPVTPQGRLTRNVSTRKKKKNNFFIALKRIKKNEKI